MRYREILNEFIIRLGNVVVFRNPLKPQILNLFKEAATRIPSKWGFLDNKLRGVVVDGKIYIWPAYDAMHLDVVQQMAREGFIELDDIWSGFYLDLISGHITKSAFQTPSVTTAAGQSQTDLFTLNKYLDRWNQT